MLKEDSMKPLILVNNENNGYFENAIANCNLFYIFKSERMINRIFRKIILKTNSSLRKILFTHWKKRASECDTIILFDTGNAVTILKYLKEYYSGKRIIFWYWNRVSRSIPVDEIKKTGVEIWSYDPGDCEKYDLKYNVQFVFPQNYGINVSTSKEYDAFFIGLDKNRGAILKAMAKHLKEAGCSFYYYLVKSKTKADSNVKQEYPYQPPVTYQKLIDMSIKSKALIDIIDEEQLGLTLRPIEGIYLKKKLITTMKHITDYDLYTPDNIFIWGVDDISKLKAFLESPYNNKGSVELKQKYSFDAWLHNFENIK